MMLSQIAVGDSVRFRGWEDMADEYGFKPSGSIRCQFSFTPGMRKLCGREYVVQRIDDQRVYLDLPATMGYSISADMLEPADVVQIEPPSETDFISILIPGMAGESVGDR